MREITWDDVAYGGPETVAQIEERLRGQWDIPDGEDPLNDLEALLVGKPETRESSIEQPASLRPPGTDGGSTAFKAAVDAYVWEMSSLRWRAKLSPQDETLMTMYLEHAELALNAPDLRVVVAGITGQEKDRSPVMLNTWLALLNRGHVAVLEDQDHGGMTTTRLVVIR